MVQTVTVMQNVMKNQKVIAAVASQVILEMVGLAWKEVKIRSSFKTY